MLRLISVSALAGLVAVAPASSQTVLPPNQQLLVGKYHFEEEGIAIDVIHPQRVVSHFGWSLSGVIETA